MLLQLLLHLLLLVKQNWRMQVSELTQQLQLTQKLREERSLQERQAVPAAKDSQVGCSEAFSKCSMASGSLEGFAWRRLPPRNANGSLQGMNGQSNATAAASSSKGHKLAVLVPYRDRPAQLETMLPALTAHLQVRHLPGLLHLVLAMMHTMRQTYLTRCGHEAGSKPLLSCCALNEKVSSFAHRLLLMQLGAA